MSESATQKVTIYSAARGNHNFFTILRDAIITMYQSRSLAHRLVVRNIKAQYTKSVLGIAWAFIPAIVSSAVWIFLNGSKIIEIDTPGIPYPAFVLTGTLLWQVFLETLQSPLKYVEANKSILVKINFSRESLLLAGLGESLFNFIIRLALIIVVFIVFAINPWPGVLLAPLGFLAMMTLGFSIGLILTPIGMLYGDVSRALQVIGPLWMLLTPVIYPAPRGGIAKILSNFNPVSPVLTATREWITGGFDVDWGWFMGVFGFSLVLGAFGLVLFRIAIPHLIARMN